MLERTEFEDSPMARWHLRRQDNVKVLSLSLTLGVLSLDTTTHSFDRGCCVDEKIDGGPAFL